MVFRAPVSLDELNGLSRSTLIEHLGIVFTAAGEDWLQATMFGAGPAVSAVARNEPISQ